MTKIHRKTTIPMTNTKDEERINNMVSEAEKDAVEIHKKRVEKAARIMALVESEGGQELVAEIERLKKEWHYTPESMFMTTKEGDQIVNSSLVARLAGGREALDALMNWFATCTQIVKTEAEKNAQKEN